MASIERFVCACSVILCHVASFRNRMFFNRCSWGFRWVLPAEEYFAADRDLCAMGLIRPAALISHLHTWFALRQYENRFWQKGPTWTIIRDCTLFAVGIRHEPERFLLVTRIPQRISSQGIGSKPDLLRFSEHPRTEAIQTREASHS